MFDTRGSVGQSKHVIDYSQRSRLSVLKHGEDILVHHLEHVGQICRLSHGNYHGHPDFKCESTKRSAHIT
jgi:hypothetical protein